jgi:hypothetical protein
MKDTNWFIDYSAAINVPLYAEVDYSQPTLSWLAMRYHGYVSVKTTREKLLKYSLAKDGYFFQSNGFTGTWKNTNYHDPEAFGLPSGFSLA